MIEAKEVGTGKLYRVLFQKAIHVSDRNRYDTVVVYAPQDALDRIFVRDEREFKQKFEIK